MTSLVQLHTETPANGTVELTVKLGPDGVIFVLIRPMFSTVITVLPLAYSPSRGICILILRLVLILNSPV